MRFVDQKVHMGKVNPMVPQLGALLPLLFWGEGSPTKVDYSKKATLIQTSLLEDLV